MTARLAALAAWMERQLGDELASRQVIAETALARIREELAARRPADHRVRYASEYLAAVRPHKVSGRPHSVLVREAAELRRSLGMVLDYVAEAAAAAGLTVVLPDRSATLAAADLARVLGALEHAETLMRERAAAWCDDCAQHPAGACQQHLDDLDQADAYRELAARLGGAS